MIVRTCHNSESCVDAGQEAVAHLAAGEIVGIATNFGYTAATRNLQNLADKNLTNITPILVLRHHDELADYLQTSRKAAGRLFSRLPNGSVILQFSSGKDSSLFDRPDDLPLLSDEVQHVAHCLNTFPVNYILSSGPLAKYAHPYTAWPLFLLWPTQTDSASQYHYCRTAQSLVEYLPNCLNYVMETGPVETDSAPAVVEFLDQGVSIIPSNELNNATILENTRAGILFVCTGNTCRSPMAEAIFRSMLAERLNCDTAELAGQGIEIASAGIAADYGHSASPEAVQLLADEGIDLSSHQSQPLTESLLERSERVYTLTNHHREIIITHRPELRDRVQVLGQDGRDIPDPIGGDVAVYRQCKEVIEQNLRLIAEEIVRELDQ
ncbi:low molecular weight protein arginine phosphatase [Rubinisphaera italica]|uniref:protein-tyrosine-phosphatase n=1 Tax=Rubinisphaera italica TaxID=2527969 RepID=A0A5C5XMC5_9PLAN|nr:low molecular weight protein arginine phosphatase [Rubinisphaera italica]TWT63533.1 Low molecular weight protein-tyrosine-phosphatase YwlE [Rubinisphaera italica]